MSIRILATAFQIFNYHHSVGQNPHRILQSNAANRQLEEGRVVFIIFGNQDCKIAIHVAAHPAPQFPSLPWSFHLIHGVRYCQSENPLVTNPEFFEQRNRVGDSLRTGTPGPKPARIIQHRFKIVQVRWLSQVRVGSQCIRLLHVRVEH